LGLPLGAASATTVVSRADATVLAFDAVLGVVTSLAGLVIALAVSAVVGILVVAVGAAYTALVGARARRWARLRREAGL